MGFSNRHTVSKLSNVLRTPVTIGIRREDPQRIWERRTPLTPDAVNELVTKKDVRVLVEPCDRRVFPVQEYVKAGATIAEDLREAHIHIGIKETPLSRVITSPTANPRANSTTPNVQRTHLMFSHTAKGQSYNTPLLAKYLASPGLSQAEASLLPRLIDYELLTNESDGKRTVGFGWYAGVAGVLESLSAMAHAHLEIGVASPFLYTPRPHTLPSLDRLRSALKDIGRRISEEGTPASLGPFIIGLTGNGNVSQGCLSMLECLPIERVSVNDLPNLVANRDANLKKIYLVHAQPAEYLFGIDGRKHSRSDYYANPSMYQSAFAEKVAPYLTLFLNGVGWAQGYPRLMTNEDLVTALQRAREIGGARFTSIGDISCDLGGGLEFMKEASTLSTPFFHIRPESVSKDLPSVQIMSVDILPTSIPYDASKHFSKALLPYMDGLIEMYANGNADSAHARALERATIAVGGQLKEQHQWLQPAVDKWFGGVKLPSEQTITTSEKIAPKESRMVKPKRILLLGSGMVAGPTVDHVARRGDVQLLIASNSSTEMQKLKGSHTNVETKVIDVKNHSTWKHLVETSDVVISLLPVPLHPVVAEACLTHRKHLITASYISDAMRSLHEQAVQSDVLLLNEIGLDPGIDHCSAISLINKLHAEKKEIVSFTSFCGGLPAPDVPNVPLRYKFSWSPRGVLTAALNSARYRLNNEMVEIPSHNLLKSYFPRIPITKDFDLEGIANRDSLPYASTYSLGTPSSLRTLLRGTLRYPGFSSLMHSFRGIGLLETDQKIQLQNWSTLLQQCLSLRLSTNIPYKETMSLLNTLIQPGDAEALHHALEWMSLIPPSMIGFVPSPMPPLPTEPMAPLDIFAHLLAYKLRYLPNERDMVILSHEIVARAKGNSVAPEEVYSSSLITHGTSKASAMARTVGIPVGIAALNVADGKVHMRGVHGPDDRSVYDAVLQGLEEVGLGMTESVSLKRDTIEKSLIPKSKGSLLSRLDVRENKSKDLLSHI